MNNGKKLNSVTELKSFLKRNNILFNGSIFGKNVRL